jgi:anti-sigma regulatory factor (Ser/Thr protein kinase)
MPSEGLGSFRRTFRPELGSAAAARRELEDLCAGVDEDLLERSRLALTEAVTNSVKHARLRPSQRIEVELALVDALLRIDVTDGGVGFRMPAMRPIQGGPDGGWGLRLIEELTDRWGVDSNHSTHVWLEFDRSS